MSKLSLSSQFLVAAALVLCVVMTVLGMWVSTRITRSVLATIGADNRGLIRGLIEPSVQNMLPDGTLPEPDHQTLDKLFVEAPTIRNIISVKIWRKDHVVIYSSMSKDVIGSAFASEEVANAFKGKIIAQFNDMTSSEGAHNHALRQPVIEIYAPLYRAGTTEIIAVGEIYDDATELADELSKSIWLTWIVVSITTILMLSILYIIVRRGDRTIRAQRADLDQQLRAAQNLAAQNAELRVIAERTRLDANEANEQLIGRIGQDLHDGPIQLLSLLMLRLSELGPKTPEHTRAESTDAIKSLTENVIEELRGLSIGLVLPEIASLSAAEAIELAIHRHENLTGTKVQRKTGELSSEISDPLKICLYRIVQETLTNSFRHAAGRGQQVEAVQTSGGVKLSIRDEGNGFSAIEKGGANQTKLGLRGIRNRVQAFGGHAVVTSSEECGTEVRILLPLAKRK